jgi:hypothetical protein
MNGLETPEDRGRYRKAFDDACIFADEVGRKFHNYWEASLRDSGASEPRISSGAPFVLDPDWEVGDPSTAAYIRNQLVELDRLRSEVMAIAEKTSDLDALNNLKSAMTQITAITNEIKEARETKRQFNSRLIAQRKLSGISEEELMNGSERDADDIGQQYFLKAGFSRYGFGDMFSVVSRVESHADFFKKCVIESGYSPTRGIISHPGSCWRFMYAAGLGSTGRQNGAEIARLGRDSPRSPVTVVFEDGYILPDAQGEIQAYFRRR